MAEPTTSSADPERLAAYVRFLTPPDQTLNQAVVGVAALVEGWNARPNDFGGRIDPDKVPRLDVAINDLSYLDVWVGRVGRAFAVADLFDRGDTDSRIITLDDAELAATVGPPRLDDAIADGAFEELFTVVRDGSDGQSRLVRLNVDDLPPEMTPLEWQLLVEAYGLDGQDGPLHTMVHGWSATTGSATRAGETAADLYDQQGVKGATVLVIDWDAGDGAGDQGLGILGLGSPLTAGRVGDPYDFSKADEQGQRTGDSLAPLLTAIASANPDIDMSITAHSLGNHVALRALTEMSDPTDRFNVDYLGVQPAIPADAATEDPDHYGALTNDRIDHLVLTINNGDKALLGYEAQGPEALGDEVFDGDGLQTLLEARGDRGIEIVDHRDSPTFGHLGIDPSSWQPLVRSLVQEQIDRTDGGGPDGQDEVRRWLYAEAGSSAEGYLSSPEVVEYLDAHQESGEAPTVEGLAEVLAQQYEDLLDDPGRQGGALHYVPPPPGYDPPEQPPATPTPPSPGPAPPGYED